VDEKVRKLAVWELQKGNLARDLQQAFEECCKVAYQKRGTTTLELKIEIEPPADPQRENTGRIFHSIKKKYPVEKSLKYYSRFDSSGFVTESAAKMIDLDQYDLDLKIPGVELHQINGGK